MTIHARCDSPPISLTIVGKAVETIVWSREASNSTSASAEKMARRLRSLVWVPLGRRKECVACCEAAYWSLFVS